MRSYTILIVFLGLISSSACKKEGCTEPTALNYDESANTDDGSCLFQNDTNNPDNGNGWYPFDCYMTSNYLVRTSPTFSSHTETIEYDSKYNPIRHDHSGGYMEMQYDSDDRLVTTLLYAGGTLSGKLEYTYNANGQLQQVDEFTGNNDPIKTYIMSYPNSTTTEVVIQFYNGWDDNKVVATWSNGNITERAIYIGDGAGGFTLQSSENYAYDPGYNPYFILSKVYAYELEPNWSSMQHDIPNVSPPFEISYVLNDENLPTSYTWDNTGNGGSSDISHSYSYDCP